MNDTSDSDDSALLFTTNSFKRKAKTYMDDTKKATSVGDKERNVIITLDEETVNKAGGSLTTQNNFSVFDNNLNQGELGKESSEKCMSADENLTSKNEKDEDNKQISKLPNSKISNYYSCPLCLKTFDTEIIHISHMKQCAKKSKMTPKQLLQALEMHKEQLKKRIYPGLSSVSPLKKKKKVVNEDDPESSYELALGLALSKSLSEINQNHPGSNNLSFKNNGMKNNKATLERFGFTNSNCNSGGGTAVGKKKLKNWKNAQFPLRERTKEERERLVTEKAAVILLCKDHELESYKEPEEGGSCDLKYENLQENEKKESLWKLGENENNTNWYVQNIKHLILDEKRECVSGGNDKNSEENKIVEEIRRLNLPRKSVFEDWRKLVNNSHLSDLNFQSKSSETFYLHSIVIYARCPTMLPLDLRNIFCGFETVTILSFLQYLYCGVLDGLEKSGIENLFDLAQAVNFEELCQVLSILKENLNWKCSEGDEISPELNKTLCEKEENMGNNLDENMKLENSIYGKEQLKVHSQVSDSNSTSSLQESERSGCVIEDVKNESSQELLRTPENKEEESWGPNKIENPVDHVEAEGEIGVTSCSRKTLNPNDELLSKCGETEDLEGDMFEEEEIFSQTSKNSDVLNINFPRSEDNIHECILVSSGSSNDGFSNGDKREELSEKNEDFPIADCEIPYFDPYEHFNSEIPVPDSPALNEEDALRSQSVFLNEISHVRLSSPRDEGTSFPELEAASPIPISSTPQSSGFCSTPIATHDTSKPTSDRDTSNRKYLKKGQRQKRSLCFKKNRSVIASRLMKTKLLRSGSVKKKRRASKDIKNDEEDPERELNILTESIIKGFENSFGVTSEKSPETPVRKFIEVTPAAAGEEFSEEVSPLPDYSLMNPSGIKKHLARYGLKKSLSKNKAKKILRHIYEELHPLINTRNGKIVKYEPMEKRAQSKKKSGRKKRKSLKDKKLELEKSVNEIVGETSWKNSGENSAGTRCEVENDISPFDGSNSFDRSEDNIFERSDSEIQGSQSQTIFSSGKDVTEAVFDFIHSNPETHRRILMYEPIWLENFREQLFDKYNKKFKLTDLMDCLDAECITFRCESQRRTNMKRKTRKTKSSNLKNIK